MDDFVYFGSGSKNKWISNFAEIPGGMQFRGLRFATSEHAFQALRVEDSEMKRFAVGGDLGSLEEGGKLVFPASKVEKKIKYWKARSSPKLSGIVPKMAINKSVKKLPKRGIVKLRPKSEVPETRQQLEKVWKEILASKHLACPQFREQLAATGASKLVELDRGAKRRSDAGDPPRWTGLVKNGVLYGQNYMGECMEKIRSGEWL